MIGKKELTKERDFLNNLHSIMETYEEIAATRMTRVRSSVLENRNFLLEINSIFQQVKFSYKARISKLMKEKNISDPSRLTFIKHNDKTLYIFISANTGLYGGIIGKTFNIFADTVRKSPGDVVILGKLGLEMFNVSGIKAPLVYFEFPDNKIDEVMLKKIADYIVKYENVLVFYEQFNSVVSQSPTVTNISGDPLPWEKNQTNTRYFFEPSLEKIMEFFEKEIFASIFQQIISESELAKFAVRMVSLDLASENTKTKLKQVILAKNRMKHQENNKKQLEKFASMKLWR